MSQRLLRLAAVFFASVPIAAAQPAERGLEVSAEATGLTTATANRAGAAAGLGWNRAGLRLAASVETARGTGYLGGFAVDRLTTLAGTVAARWRIFERAGVGFELGGAAGLRASWSGDAMLADDRGLVAGGELEARAVIGAGRVRGVLGLALPVWMSVQPTVEPDELSQLTRGGVEIAVDRDLWLTVMGETGGAYGYNGDGAKFRAGLRIGITWRREAARPASPAEHRGSVGAFVATEWRAFALADHVSHGPAVSAGVTLLRGRLKLGFLAHGRPGAINPATFDATTVDGQAYRGRSTIPLRSDGAFLGVVAAPAFSVGPVRIELPVAVGQAAYGFYLAGDDRETPDRRRVSEWEDELFAGRDSSFALGGEVGVLVAAPLRSWLEPYLAARYSFTVGYETIVRDDYSGPSLGIGVQLRP